MIDIFDAIKNRRSVRAFKPDPVPDEHLEIMLSAARYAPTAGNDQPWCFLVVRARDNLERLQCMLEQWARGRVQASAATPEERTLQMDDVLAYIGRVFSAPLFIFLFVDTGKYPELVVFDGALAAENLMLAARALGYGTCFQTTFFPEEIVREHFGVPENLRLICAIPVGHPVGWPSAPPKKPLSELTRYEHMSREAP